jgi:hypothetical protein
MTGISLPAHFEIGTLLYRSTRLKLCATSRKVEGSIPYALNGPWVDSASHRNEYQGYLMTRRGGRCVRLTALLPSYTDFLEIPVASTSWSPNGLRMPNRDSFTVLFILYKMEVFIITMCLNVTYHFLFQKNTRFTKLNPFQSACEKVGKNHSIESDRKRYSPALDRQPSHYLEQGKSSVP